MTRRTLIGLAVAAVLGTAAAGAAQAPTNWAQFRAGPAHTGYNPTEHSLSAASVRRLRPAWAHRTSQPVWSSPAVVGTTVFIGSNDRRVYALRASDGRQVWSAEVGGRAAAPAVFRGMVYVFADDGSLTAFANGVRRLVDHRLVRQGGFPAAPTLV